MTPQDTNYTNQLYDPVQNGQNTPKQNVPPANPGLDFQPNAPSGLEMPITPAAETVELKPEATAEFEIAPEITKPTPSIQHTNQNIPTTPIQPTPVIPTVVNKTTNKEKLHSVSPNADAITSLADKEEEEFITEVEKHHVKS